MPDSEIKISARFRDKDGTRWVGSVSRLEARGHLPRRR
jgi:hypothetical protein